MTFRGKIVVFEEDEYRRERWKSGRWQGYVHVRRSPQTLLTWSTHRDRDPEEDCVVVGLSDGLGDTRWAALQSVLGSVRRAGLRIIVDAARCDLEQAVALSTMGAALCAESSADPTAIDRLLMRGTARTGEGRHEVAYPRRLLHTIAASELAKRHGLTPRHYRVVRTLMDVDYGQVARTLHIAPKTLEKHMAKIRQATEKSTAGFMRETFELAQECAWHLRTVL